MRNIKQVREFLESRYENGLAMIDVVAHGSFNQVDKLRMEFGGCDSYTEDSNRYKNKKMVITPFIIYGDGKQEVDSLMQSIKNFTQDIDGTKSVEVEVWTYTDEENNGMMYEGIKVIKY